MARQFDGIADEIQWGDVTFLDGGLAGATWVGWIRPDWAGTLSAASIWRKDAAWTPYQRDELNNWLRCNIWGTSFGIAQVFASSYTWTAGIWHFAAVVFDNSTSPELKFYAAQKGDTSLTLAGSNTQFTSSDLLQTSDQPMMMGSNGAGGEWFKGDLAFLAALNIPLSQAQVLAIKNNPDAVLLHGSNLKFYARLCGTQSPEPDIAGGLSGTVVGAVKSYSEYPCESGRFDSSLFPKFLLRPPEPMPL